MTRLHDLERLLGRVRGRRRDRTTPSMGRSALAAPRVPREPAIASQAAMQERQASSPPSEAPSRPVSRMGADGAGPSRFVSTAPTEPTFGQVLTRTLGLRLKED